jgi:predicted adenylyl cyclase CyaB
VNRNIEIKAQARDIAEVRQRASAIGSPPQLLAQTDTFFVVPRGRLKLREFGDGSGELIAYERPNDMGPKESKYTVARVGDVRALSEALARSLGVKGRVVKRREVFLVGRTRVHLDQVENLGSFVELEVVLRDDESVNVGEREAFELMDRLGISPDDLVPDAYIDLLERKLVTT